MRAPQSMIKSLTHSHVHPFDPTCLKTFGSLCYATDKDQKSKVGALARQFIFVGLEEGAHSVRLWDKNTHRIFVTGNLIHREDVFAALDKVHVPTFETSTFNFDSDLLSSLSAHPPTPSSPASTEDLIDPHIDVSPSPDGSTSGYQNQVSSPSANSITSPDFQSNSPPDPSSELTPKVADQPVLRRSTRSTVVPDWYGFSATTGTDSNHPTYAQAMAGPDRLAWRKAMEEEFALLLQHDVGTLVDPPAGANIVGGMWVFNRKRDAFNQIVRYKAR